MISKGCPCSVDVFFFSFKNYLVEHPQVQNFTLLTLQWQQKLETDKSKTDCNIVTIRQLSFSFRLGRDNAISWRWALLIPSGECGIFPYKTRPTVYRLLTILSCRKHNHESSCCHQLNKEVLQRNK